MANREMMIRDRYLIIRNLIEVTRATQSEQAVRNVVIAAGFLEKGTQAYHANDLQKAVTLHEQAISQLTNVEGVEMLRAMIQSALVASYARTNRLTEAIASARAALPFLTSEPRLSLDRANCMHDLGAALSQCGRLEEAVPCFQEALAFYESDRGDAALAKACRDNMKTVQSAIQVRKKTDQGWRSWWSKLWCV
jgi:tetratricopeptide (TPR) repeat protein